MNTYNEFHGNIQASDIGKRLREIAKKETAFKIMTGYGSSSGKCQSKKAALNSLKKMRQEGLITAYIPGEKVTELIANSNDPYRDVKERYKDILRTDRDSGNDGIVFVFVK